MDETARALILEVEQRLRQAFAPERLLLRDESSRHRHHPGRGSGLHLSLEIVSDRFRGWTPLQRHRAVHAVLADLLPGPIHALALEARAPQEPPRGARRSG